MGIVYSVEKLAARCGDTGILASPDYLRSTGPRIEAYLKCYHTFRYPPMVDNINLHSYFMNVDKRGELDGGNAGLVALLWSVFEVQSICYMQEIISCLVLLSAESWHVRLGYLFDIFACSGGDEMTYDDLVMAAQVIATTLHRLWMSASWDQGKWSHLTESLADSAYAKLEKDLDSALSKEEFVRWAAERFKDSKSVSSPEALALLYSSPF